MFYDCINVCQQLMFSVTGSTFISTKQL